MTTEFTHLATIEDVQRIRAGDVSIPLVSHEAQLCCTNSPCQMNLPPFEDIYPEALRAFHYSPELYADHLRSLNRHLMSALSCWPGCWVSLIPICTPVCCCLCMKAYIDSGDALRHMRITVEGINTTLRQNGIPCEWRYCKETHYTHNENGHDSQENHHYFRVYVGQPALPTQPPPGQAMQPMVPVVWQQQAYTAGAQVPAGGVTQGIAVGIPGHPYPMHQAQQQGQYTPMQGPGYPPDQAQQQCAPPPPPSQQQQAQNQCAPHHDAQPSAAADLTNTVSTLQTTSAPTV